VVSQDPTEGETRAVGDAVTVNFGVEGAVVPDLFSGGNGNCPAAATQAQANNRITSAGLTMTTQVGDDDYTLSWNSGTNQFDPAALSQCEGRVVNQSPPPGTIVGMGTAVTVAFDPVRAPRANDIFGRLVADVADAYQGAVTLEPAPTNGGVCNSGTYPPGTIGQIDPSSNNDIPLSGGEHTLHYWIVDTLAANNCLS
jgi:hypothetical protein